MASAVTCSPPLPPQMSPSRRGAGGGGGPAAPGRAFLAAPPRRLLLLVPLLAAAVPPGGSFRPVVIVHGLFDSPSDFRLLRAFINEVRGAATPGERCDPPGPPAALRVPPRVPVPPGGLGPRVGAPGHQRPPLHSPPSPPGCWVSPSDTPPRPPRATAGPR